MKAFDGEERIENLLLTKTYSQLTEEEKKFVLNELGSEEQYNAMRRVTLALITSKADLSPDPDILQSLQQKMQVDRHPSFVPWHFLFVRTPAYFSAILVMIAIAVTWLASRRTPQPQSQIVEVMKYDTVFVTRTQTDTIYRNRVIYRRAASAYSYDKNYLQVVNKTEPGIESEEKGVSMKDKQELEMLLVSGSE